MSLLSCRARERRSLALEFIEPPVEPIELAPALVVELRDAQVSAAHAFGIGPVAKSNERQRDQRLATLSTAVQ
jgi:hypothetical protein